MEALSNPAPFLAASLLSRPIHSSTSTVANVQTTTNTNFDIPDVSLFHANIVQQASTGSLASAWFDSFRQQAVPWVLSSNKTATNKRKRDPSTKLSTNSVNIITSVEDPGKDSKEEKMLKFRMARAIHEIERSGIVSVRTSTSDSSVLVKRNLYSWIDS